MSSTWLRQYAEHECAWEGYPYAWAHPVQDFAAPATPVPLRPPIKDHIRELAGHRCQRCRHPYVKGEHGNGEWSPCDSECMHGPPVREGATTIIIRDLSMSEYRMRLATGQAVEAQWRILTVHHLDEDKGNCRWWNLVALCQRCHLRMQRAVVMGRPYHYEHSEWFKPYAAGFYAWKYERADLERHEVEARMADLLKYEHEFDAETLF